MTKQYKSKTETVPDTPFSPTRCFLIAKHSGLSQQIKVYDITSDVDFAKYTTGADLDKWSSAAQKIGTAKAKESATPFLQIQRNTWYGHKFTAFKPSLDVEKENLAIWDGGWFSSSSNRISFPAESQHCSHPIKMTVDSYFKMRDKFVIENVPYMWAVLNVWSMRQFRLSRTLCGTVNTMARFWKSKVQVLQGGVLVVDDKEMDVVVTIMTCMVMVRKQRQKEYEHTF